MGDDVRDHEPRTQGLTATYIPAMLIDHPVDSDRIAEQRARAAQFPPRTGKDSQSYELIRERVRVLDRDRRHRHGAQYAQKIAHGDDTLGNRYGEALALMNGNQRRARRSGSSRRWCSSTRG